MSICAGIDVGSTYTKAVLLKDGETEIARAVHKTGFRLPEVARRVYDEALAAAGLTADDVDYVVATSSSSATSR